MHYMHLIFNIFNENMKKCHIIENHYDSKNKIPFNFLRIKNDRDVHYIHLNI